MTLSPRQACALLNLARSTIRAVLGGDAGRDSNPSNLATIDPQIANDPALQQPAGCFVSLHDLVSRRLRGCVGRLDARDPLHLAVIDSARSVLDDPRFGHDPVTLQQLARMEIEISVLSPMRDASDVLAFDPIIDGIYLTIGPRSGCFLPQVGRETGWSREQLLERLCSEKLEMTASAWKSPEAKLRTFSALVIGPEAFEM